MLALSRSCKGWLCPPCSAGVSGGSQLVPWAAQALLATELALGSLARQVTAVSGRRAQAAGHGPTWVKLQVTGGRGSPAMQDKGQPGIQHLCTGPLSWQRKGPGAYLCCSGRWGGLAQGPQGKPGPGSVTVPGPSPEPGPVRWAGSPRLGLPGAASATHAGLLSRGAPARTWGGWVCAQPLPGISSLRRAHSLAPSSSPAPAPLQPGCTAPWPTPAPGAPGAGGA